MTICRYYLQGNCRFGDRCRFEHTDPYSSDSEDSYISSNKKQGYNRQQDSFRNRQNKYDPDLSYGPQRYDYQSQDRYASGYTSDTDHYGSQTNYNQYQYDSYNRSYQKDKYSVPQKSVLNAYATNNRYNDYQKHSNYLTNKYNKNQYEWVSEDYKQKHQKSQVEKNYSRNQEYDTDESRDRVDEKNIFLAEKIKEDITAWELGNQWPFTCYHPFPDKEGFPGFSDVSFEELRFETLKAEQNGSFDTFISEVQKAIHDVNNRRNQMKQPSNQLLSVIEKLRTGQHVSNESRTVGGFSFMNQTTPNNAPHTQNAASTFNFKSAFEQTTQSSAFSNTESSASTFSFKSALDKDVQSQVSPFNLKSALDTDIQSTASSFSFKSALDKNIQSTASSFSFKSALDKDMQSSTSTSSDSSSYTPMDQLSDEDREQFSASTFTLGKIPTVPPPKMLCF